MNKIHRHILSVLLDGGYIRPYRSHTRFKHRLYIGNQIPVIAIADGEMKLLNLYLVKRKGKLEISRKLIRSEDGRRSVKRFYKKFMKGKKVQHGSNVGG